MKIRIQNTRIAFTQALFEAKARKADEKPAWSSTFILEGKGDHEVEVQAADGTTADGKAKFKWVKRKISQVLSDVAAQKWGAKGEAILKSIKLNNDICLRDGDAKPDYDGFPGNMFLSGRNPKTAPLVLSKNGQPVTESSGVVYAGCYVHAVLDIYAQDNDYGRRINCGIQTVMFAKDGDSFGGGGRGSADDFGDLTVPSDDGFDDLAA